MPGGGRCKKEGIKLELPPNCRIIMPIGRLMQANNVELRCVVAAPGRTVAAERGVELAGIERVIICRTNALMPRPGPAGRTGPGPRPGGVRPAQARRPG